VEVLVIRVVGVLLGLLPPSALKNRLMTWCVPGWRVAADASVGSCVLWGISYLEVGPGAIVGFGNVFRTMRRVTIGSGAAIGQFNWFSAAAKFATPLDGSLTGSLELAGRSAITSRHYLDCSGGIAVGEASIIGGLRTTLVTHGVVQATATVEVAPIRIGDHCLINTSCVVMGGVTIGDRCVVGAGAVVTRDLTDRETLYGGVPARPIRSLAGSPLFDRPSHNFIPRGSGTVAGHVPVADVAPEADNGRAIRSDRAT
jgi:acetyltransferase-like isoleucine patch superfamily enzyme